ncbi:MAG: hypothetical protein JRN20_20215 [Nitrososphaerota archaeon]|nr:hypothetical protein [Nitrososphaerota archaeon]
MQIYSDTNLEKAKVFTEIHKDIQFLDVFLNKKYDERTLGMIQVNEFGNFDAIVKPS